MNITNRLYTYPILSEDKDDYKNSTFQVNASHKMLGVNILEMSFEISMDCPGLQQLLNNGKAEFLIHIECSETAFRTVLRSQFPSLKFNIPIGRINGSIERVAFIIAKEPIKNLTCQEWNDDFEGMSFSIEKGSILAYQNLAELDIEKDYEEFSNASSLFMIYKKITSDEKPMEIDLENNKIKIGLGANEYNIYKRFYKHLEMQPILNTMIIFPVLVYVFEELKQEDGIERYRTRNWYISLERSYKRRGMNFEDEIISKEKQSVILAQEAMEYPISKGLAQIVWICDKTEE